MGPTAEVFVFAAISGGGLVPPVVLMYPVYQPLLQLYLWSPSSSAVFWCSFRNFLGRKFILYPERSTNMPDPLQQKKGISHGRSLLLPQTTSHSSSPRSRIAFPVVPWHSRKAALPGASSTGGAPPGCLDEHRLHSRVSGAAAPAASGRARQWPGGRHIHRHTDHGQGPSRPGKGRHRPVHMDQVGIPCQAIEQILRRPMWSHSPGPPAQPEWGCPPGHQPAPYPPRVGNKVVHRLVHRRFPLIKHLHLGPDRHAPALPGQTSP